jgi:hypothetical protein
MPKLAADPIDVLCVEDYLRQHAELAHLRVRKRGALMILESGPQDDAVPHARLRRATKQWWTPELPSHTGTWSPLPARLPIREALDLLRTDFAWVLTPQQ